MSNQRYPEEFKIEAVKSHRARFARCRCGGASRRVRAQPVRPVKRYSKPQAQRQQVDDQQVELRRLRANSR